MSLPSRLLGANPSIQVSTLLSGSLTTPSAKGTFVEPGSYESIETITVGAGGSSTVTFSSIPQTYAHLELRSITKDTVAANGSFNLRARFNSDSGSNYNLQRLYGGGTSASADNFSGQTSAVVGNISANGFTSVFGAGVCQILDYANSNKYKTIRTLAGADTNSTDKYVFFLNCLWVNTSAITSITLITDGTAFAQYSQFALYGIKGT